MGLLGKAVLNERPSRPAEKADCGNGGLDEMGKALRDRLLSLSGTEPETAISLLKAYGSFRAGACLSLDGDLYRSYAAVGIEQPMELSPDLLQKIPGGNRYSVVYTQDSGGPRNAAGIRGIPAGTKLWAFSLDENDSVPPGRILLVGEDKNYIFPGAAVESLLEAAKSAFAPSSRAERETPVEIMIEDDFPFPAVSGEQPPVQKTGGLLALVKKHLAEPVNAGSGSPPAGSGSLLSGSEPFPGGVTDNRDEEKVRMFLSGALKKNASVHGLVFEGDGRTEEFAARIQNMVSGFADTAELRAGRCLVAGGASLDCELLSHRLSASLPGKKILWFSAENPEEALGALRAYL
jgi:hypothetical protein